MKRLFLAVALLTAGPPLAAQTGSELQAGIDRLLEISEIEGVLSARGPAFTRQVARMMEDPTDDELERLVASVTASFGYDSLYRDVKAFLVAEASARLVAEALSWLEAGAAAEVRRIAAAYEPPQSLEEYMREFTVEPPSRSRILLMRQLAESQSTADFYVLMQEALREAAQTVWAALRSDAPPFEPITGGELRFNLENSLGASVMSFLHRYETVPDELIQGAVAEWGSDSGQWYASTYLLAVAGAIRAAGQRVVGALNTHVPAPR